MKDYKFKIGDRVKVINRPAGCVTNSMIGKTAKIVAFCKSFDYAIEFEEKNVGCHNCNGCVPSFNGLYADDNNLELIAPKNNKKIVITSDGVETIAKLYEDKKVIKSATAKCSPNDEFNFETGAKVAFDRLIGNEEKSKYKAGDKVKVIANTCCHGYTIGDIVTLAKIHELGQTPWNVKEGTTYIRERDFEPYKEPEYFTGKVVCIESKQKSITVGKVYDFSKNNGCGESDNGTRIIDNPSRDIDDLNSKFYSIKFIPFVE